MQALSRRGRRKNQALVVGAKARLPRALKDALAEIPAIALAFSGGIDSRFLAHAALLCGNNVLAINVSGPHMGRAESEYARNWAQSRKLEFATVECDPLKFYEVANNGRDRCYFCKWEMLAKIAAFVAKRPEKGLQICDGGNVDDQNKYRPGLKAVVEAGVISPLAMAGLTKPEIRRLAAQTGLDNPSQPAKACLLTRLNYGLSPNPELLGNIAACEAKIAAFLTDNGLPEAEFRLRLTPEPVVQIEDDAARFGPELAEIAAASGFRGTRILAGGKISGFFDRRAGNVLA